MFDCNILAIYFFSRVTAYVNNEEDTYLTLEILTAILEALSESGKNIFGLDSYLSGQFLQHASA